MPAGPEPTKTGPPGWPVAESIRVTVPSWPLATQTAPGPTAMPSGPAPTGMPSLVGVRFGGLIGRRVPSPRWAPHPPRGPPAMAAGTLPTRIVLTTLLAAALTHDTVPSPLLATHTSPPPVTV